MKYELKELTINLIDDDLYNMYQDIPDGDNGQTNEAYHISKNEFRNYIINQIRRKNNKINDKDTPTITYILYANNKAVGYICLRTKIDNKWLKWSGNFYYQIKKTERRKGYGTKILELGLIKLKKLGFTVVYGQSSKGNIGSAKVIEKNNGILIEEIEGSRYYKINL